MAIQHRRGTAAEATSANAVLATGQLGVETDRGRIKVGDNTTAWNSRPYVGGAMLYDVKSYGAIGDGVTDDTVAIQAAMDAAKISAGPRRGGTVFIPAGRYLISAPIKLFTAVSVIGEGWSLDSTFYNVSALVAAPGFTGSTMLIQDADGGTVSDPTPRPDRSWHWGVIEKLLFKGNRVSRTVTDGALNSTTTVTSATAAFVAGDVGSSVRGVGIPSATTIVSVTNATTAVLSIAATATATAVTLNIIKFGPHGLDPGWCGEASTIRNCSFTQCNSGIYLNDVQASCTLDNVSMFFCNIGLNCDALTASTVRVFGLSGDNNTHLLRVKGGLASNVSVFSMKGESYETGTGDPLVEVTDLAGGALTIVGGWADTNSARLQVIRVSQPGASGQRPRITLIGYSNNGSYTNLLKDVFDNQVIATGYGLSYPAIFYNLNMGVLGAGNLGIGYGRSMTGITFGGGTMPLVSSGADDGVVVHAGSGGVGGRLMDSAYTNTLMQWRKNGANNLSFFGVEPVARPTAPTAADSAAVDATYGTEEAAVINNMRTRIGELETKLRSLGLIT